MSGSGKGVIVDWKVMKITSLLLIPMGLWLVISLIKLSHMDHEAAKAWLSNGMHAGILAAFLIVGLHHSAHGVQVVIEDYIDKPAPQKTALMLNKIVHLVCLALGLIPLITLVFKA
jgi:succinate dehydrogenase / fumarate reductase membrane anchor subunit